MGVNSKLKTTVKQLDNERGLLVSVFINCNNTLHGQWQQHQRCSTNCWKEQLLDRFKLRRSSAKLLIYID